MPQKSMRASYIAQALFVAAIFVTSGFEAGASSSLTLTPKALGPLPLGKEAKVSESLLKKLFPSFTIKYDIGFGDSPAFHYFEVLDEKGDLLFTIKSFIEDSAKSEKTTFAVPISILKIHSPKIRDAYGLKVGNRVKEIIAKRGKGLQFGAAHHDVYLGANAIFYGLGTGSDWSPVQFTVRDAVKENWTVRYISWPVPAWE